MPTAPDALPTRSSDHRSRKRRRGLRRAIIACAVLVGLVATGVGAAALIYHNAIGTHITTLPDSDVFPREQVRPPAPSTGEKNILLLGSDARETGQALDTAGGRRSDVMMLVNVPADRKHVSVMSIMRDTWLPVPGHGEAKVNSAFSWGGTPLAVQTVESYLGVRIDHVAIIDFEGIKGMTSALGGVHVENAIPFTAGGRFYAGGPISLQGEDALRYVRERHAFADADFQRVTNQQALLKGILAKAVSRDVLADPTQLLDFASETSKFLTVDARFTTAEAGSLAFSLRGIDAKDFSFFTMPTSGTGTSPDGQSIVNADPAAVAELRAALKNDTLSELERSRASS